MMFPIGVPGKSTVMHALSNIGSIVHKLIAMCIPQAPKTLAEYELRYLCYDADMAG